MLQDGGGGGERVCDLRLIIARVISAPLHFNSPGRFCFENSGSSIRSDAAQLEAFLASTELLRCSV